MSDSLGEPWSDNPNAPQIPDWVYFEEKAYFAGVIIGAVLYGIVIALFFQCMGALLNPVNRRTRAVKWGLVVHTGVMFVLVTLCCALAIDYQGVSYIDNRGFPGVDGVLPSGPLGYEPLTYADAINFAPGLLFLLNQWLADGFLLHRCYIIYAMNGWAIVIPGLMYLASIATGVTLAQHAALHPDIGHIVASAEWIVFSYFMISLSLNVLLTLMIVARLILYSRNIQNAMGVSVEDGGLYKSIVTILVESCALYATSFLLYIVTWSVKDNKGHISGLFEPILLGTQVIAPFLVILRVANRSALTSNTIAFKDPGSIRFRSRGQSVGDDGTLPDGDPGGSMEMSWVAPGELGVVIGKPVEEVSLEGSFQT